MSRRHSLTLWAGLILVGLHVVTGLLTLVWTPYDPTAMGGGRLTPPSLEHWLVELMLIRQPPDQSESHFGATGWRSPFRMNRQAIPRTIHLKFVQTQR